MRIRVRRLVPPPLRINAMRQVLIDLTREMGRDIEKDMRAITADWEHKPDFKVTTHATISANRMDTIIETEDKPFIFVSEGTRAHFVPRRGIRTMAFRRYKAKSRVLWVGSRPGGRFGPVIVRRGRWKVSGIKARKYDEALARKWQPIIERRAYDAITSEAIAAGGHGL